MRRWTLLMVLAVAPTIMMAQTPILDTLPASIKVAEMSETTPQAGKYTVAREYIQKIQSPTGEADVMKFVQTLPGIATGAEGSSSIYARGSNIGNNLITIDGVPIYSSTHLMGLSSSFSPFIIKSTDFYIGGFTSEDGNLTASHIKMNSVDGDFTTVCSDMSISNFLLSAGISMPIVKDKLSFICSFRISPLGLEYRAARNIINKYQSLFTDFSATSYDCYGKLKYLIDGKNSLSLSFFDTSDKYSITRLANSVDAFGWGNYFVNLQYDGTMGDNLKLTGNLSYNDNKSNQSMERVLSSLYNKLEIRNALKELTLASTVSNGNTNGFHWQGGIKVRYGILNPGSSQIKEAAASSVPLTDNSRSSIIATLHGETGLSEPKQYELRASARINAYCSNVGLSPSWRFNPELSLLARYYSSEVFGIEVTADYLTQYYHTLEGIPMGWSLDMIVPSDKVIKPEKSLQGYAGVFGDFGHHHIVLGGYYKQMKNLVYYPEAKTLFTSMLSAWHENVEIGDGTSYGAEFQYEKTGDRFSYKLAYTYSKTDRLFANLNNGKPFPAKFDRRHIANATADYSFIDRPGFKLGINTAFTYQSGHWETVRAGTIMTWRIWSEEEVEMPYAPGINNYKMPDFIRWDNSLSTEIKRGKFSHNIRLGIYNTLNRHNPFALIYDEQTDEWKTISLIPIMPSIYYRISF